jgi:hypothetical protein
MKETEVAPTAEQSKQAADKAKAGEKIVQKEKIETGEVIFFLFKIKFF